MHSVFWCSYSTYFISFIHTPFFINTHICIYNIAKACEGDEESCMNAAWSKLRPEYVFNLKAFIGIIPIINKEILDIARCIIFSELKHNSKSFDYMYLYILHSFFLFCFCYVCINKER